MKEKITVGGSAADPTHLGHRSVIEYLLNCGRFNRIIWIPSGSRKDKRIITAPDHRVAMTMLTLPKEWLYNAIPVFLVNFQDVYTVNRPTFYWLKEIKRQYPNAEISWYTGVDSVVPQERFGGRCEIEATWFNGLELMEECHFYILPRGKGYPHPSQLSLPKNFEILDEQMPDISSTDIVRKIARGQEFEDMVTPEVAAYIKRFGLYNWQKGEN